MSTTTDPHPYKVLNDRGAYVLQSTNECKHDPETELYLLLSHHQIIDNGVELTIEDIEHRIGNKKQIAEIRERHASFA